MARYVVLSFDDNIQAEMLVEDWHRSLEEKPEGEKVQLLTPNQENNVECTIVGLLAKPVHFCDQSDGHLKGYGKTGAGYTRGTKFGWWICAVCKKPTKGWAAGWKPVVADGRNLLNDFLAELEEEEKAL